MGWVWDCDGRIGQVGLGWFRFEIGGWEMFVLVDMVYSRVKLGLALA